jgi:DNA-binding transcriptional ArsR family regulator
MGLRECRSLPYNGFRFLPWLQLASLFLLLCVCCLFSHCAIGGHTSDEALYGLTGIYLLVYILDMRSAFEIIAEPNRRAILSLLVSSQRSVGEIESRLRMSQPTVSKHLRVLRDAGFVDSTVDAQRRLYRLKPQRLQELDDWLAQFRRLWSTHLDALERHLDRMEQPTPTKKKKRRTK